MNIHLLSLFYSDDLKTYGFNKILKPFIDDLKILETEGIQLPFFENPLFGSVIQLTGYNVTVNELSDRLHSFSYGYTDRKNRPGNLKIDDNSKHLGLNAALSWCVLCHTPLIFGDVIERVNDHWNLLLLFIQIVNIVFSPIVTDVILCFLKHLIWDHHNLFKLPFPDSNLIPKHHLMIHYPRCMKFFFPLSHMWCM